MTRKIRSSVVASLNNFVKIRAIRGKKVTFVFEKLSKIQKIQ
jgi:hypothetical protein